MCNTPVAVGCVLLWREVLCRHLRQALRQLFGYFFGFFGGFGQVLQRPHLLLQRAVGWLQRGQLQGVHACGVFVQLQQLALKAGLLANGFDLVAQRLVYHVRGPLCIAHACGQKGQCAGGVALGLQQFDFQCLAFVAQGVNPLLGCDILGQTAVGQKHFALEVGHAIC